MTAPILTTILFVPLILLILSGRGDNLIAGYNTASEKEREQFNMKRLRLVIAGILLATLILFWISVLMNDKDPYKFIVLIGMFPICFIGIILANTWAKKKKLLLLPHTELTSAILLVIEKNMAIRKPQKIFW